MTITESERMALCTILLEYIRTEGHTEDFIDVTHGVTTTADGLLARLVCGDDPLEVAYGTQ